MAKSERVVVGDSDTPREMGGMPVYYGEQELGVVISLQDVKDGMEAACNPLNYELCDLCAISIAFKRQFQAPLAKIGKANAYLALPTIHGVEVEGFPGKYAVFAYEVRGEARRIVEGNDKGTNLVEAGTIVMLKPRRISSHTKQKAKENSRNPLRLTFGKHIKQPGKKNGVLEDGVRNYTGRIWT